MMNLLLLGRIDLEDADGRSPTPLLRQTKRLAVLAYLVFARGKFVRREELLGLFWPESDQDRARNALKQAVHFLRRSVGSEVIVARGVEELGIAKDLVRCDALAFEAALAAGDLPGALELYRGELLPGLFLEGCSDWQDWLDRERSRLARAATAAARELSSRDETAGNWLAAVRWARRARSCSPFDETSLRELVRLLARAGDRAEALLEYERFAEWTRQVFDDEPDPETRALIDEIRSTESGPVCATPISGAAVAAVPAPMDQPMEVPSAVGEPEPLHTPTTPAERSGDASRPERIRAARTVRRRLRVAAWSIAALSVLVVLRGAVIAHVWSETAGTDAAPVLIAIAPFREFGRPAADHAGLAGALTATVARQLAQVTSFDVVPGEGTLVAGNGREHADAGGRASEVRVVLTGTVFRSSKNIRVGYALVDTRSGAITRADTVERPTGDLLPVVDDLALQITSAVREELGRERRRRLWQGDPRSRDVTQLLQEAAWQREHASALARVGVVPGARRALDSADSVLAIAAARVPNWAPIQVRRAELAEQMGWLYLQAPQDLSRQQSAWQQGIVFATSAIDLDPQTARGWEMRGVLRYMRWGTSLAQSRPRQALLDNARLDLERATSLDHALPRSWSILSAILSTEGRLAEAHEAARQALASDDYLEADQEILIRL